MQFIDDGRPASKRVAIGNLILFLLVLNALFLIVGYKPVDPIVYNLVHNSDPASIKVAIMYFLVTTVMYGMIPWLLGRSAAKKGNEKGEKLKKLAFIIPICYVFVQIMAGFY